MLADAVVRLFNNESSHKLIFRIITKGPLTALTGDFNRLSTLLTTYYLRVRSLKEYPRLRPCRKAEAGHGRNLSRA